METMTIEQAYTKLQDLESVASRHYDSGLHLEAAELRQHIERTRMELDDYVLSQRDKIDNLTKNLRFLKNIVLSFLLLLMCSGSF